MKCSLIQDLNSGHWFHFLLCREVSKMDACYWKGKKEKKKEWNAPTTWRLVSYHYHITTVLKQSKSTHYTYTLSAGGWMQKQYILFCQGFPDEKIPLARHYTYDEDWRMNQPKHSIINIKNRLHSKWLKGCHLIPMKKKNDRRWSQKPLTFIFKMLHFFSGPIPKGRCGVALLSQWQKQDTLSLLCCWISCN